MSRRCYQGRGATARRETFAEIANLPDAMPASAPDVPGEAVPKLSAMALALAVLAGCAAPSCGPLPGQAGITARLYFGRTLKDGGAIGDAAWRDFLSAAITPRFPDGLTIVEASGQWRQRATSRIVAEPSTVVEIATDAGSATLAKLEAIRAEYRARFGQESVGLVTSRSCASF
jgi:hypothetical protein